MAASRCFRSALLLVLCMSSGCRSWQPVPSAAPIPADAERIRVSTADAVIESDVYDVRGDTLVVFTPLWESGQPAAEILRVARPEVVRLERRMPDYTRTAVAAVAVSLALILGLTDLVTGPEGG